MSEMSAYKRVILGLSGVTLISFFLPWVNQTGFLSGNTIGIDLATTTESAASGKNLTVLFLTPLAAIAVALLALPAVGRSFGRWAPIGQIALAIVAVVVPLLVISSETDYWTSETSYAYGLWLTILAMAGVVVLAVMDLMDMSSSGDGERTGMDER